jgi:DnaJ-class molecular chaperone
MTNAPFHVVHCPECGGNGVVPVGIPALAVAGDETRRVYKACANCEGTGHLILPFEFRVTLESSHRLAGYEEGEAS